MEVMLQQRGSWDLWEFRQRVGDGGLGSHVVAATRVTRGWLAEVLLVGGADMGRLELHKVHKALREGRRVLGQTGSWPGRRIQGAAAGKTPAHRVPSAGRCVAATGVSGLSAFRFPAAGRRGPFQRYGLLAHSPATGFA